MPEKLDRCVEDVKSQGKSESSAFAICNSSIKSAKEMSEKFASLQSKRKKRQKTDIHLLLNTKIASIDNLKLNTLKLKLKGLTGALSPQDEAVFTRLLKKFEDDSTSEMRDDLTTKMQMRQDVAARLEADPENDVLKEELERKDSDLTFMIQSVLDLDKKERGGVPLSIAKLTAKVLTAFDESKIKRDDKGQFAEKDTRGSKGDDKKESGESKRVDVIKVINFMENKVDPDNTGDVNSGFSDSLLDETAKKFNISREDAEEIWDSGGTTDKKIMTLGDTQQRGPTEGKKQSISSDNLESLKEDARKNPEIYNLQNFDPQMHVDSKILKKIHADLGNKGMRNEEKTEQINEMIAQLVESEEFSDEGLAKKPEKKSEAKPDRAMRGVDTLVEKGRISKAEGERLKKVIEEERRFQKASPEEQARMEQEAVEAEEREAWESLSPKEKAQIKKLREMRDKLKRKKTANLDYRSGKMRTGSLVDEFRTANGDRYVTYFLINDTENLKGWGVTAPSIPQHVGTFKNMPFVITSNKFFPKSVYGEYYDHPSTEHFGKLGIRVGVDRPRQANDMMQQAAFQEEFRVGNIEEVIKTKTNDWLAFVKIKPEFANMQMPPLVSPAIFQLNPREPQNQISTWVGMHLAGLDERPAYGNYAVFRGSCFGTKGQCMTQLSASMPRKMAYLPPCAMKKMYNARLKVATMKIAAMISSDHPAIKRQNILKKKKRKTLL